MSACLFENYFFLLYGDAARGVYSSLTSRTKERIALSLKVLGNASVCAIILLVTLSSPNRTNAQTYYRFMVIPYLFSVSTLCVMLQPPTDRGGLWRYLNESRVMNVLGYLSYPIYLLQQVMFNFYGRILFDDLKTGQFPVSDKTVNPLFFDAGQFSGNDWFGDHPWWWKLLGLICLVIFCWPIQKYFQDTWVAKLASSFMLRQARATTSHTAEERRYSPCLPRSVAPAVADNSSIDEGISVKTIPEHSRTI